MAVVDLKQFMRKHGFRHLRDHDRGATWGNGVLDIFVEKNFQRESGKLRSLMDQVRDGERKKAQQQKHEEASMQKAEQRAAQTAVPRVVPRELMTPEDHRKQQAIIAAKMEEPAVETTTTAPAAEPQPEKAASEKKFRKFSGPERMYVYGRIKAMFQGKMDNVAIAAALQAEGIKLPSGRPMDAAAVGQCRWNWEKNPDRAARYAAILMPRRKAPEAQEVAPRPVVVAEAPKVQRSRFGLPLSVDAVLADPAVGESERLAILMVFVTVPQSAASVMLDGALTTRQKIAVVEALGERRKPENRQAVAREVSGHA
jgi:hypothetical protein